MQPRPTKIESGITSGIRRATEAEVARVKASQAWENFVRQNPIHAGFFVAPPQQPIASSHPPSYTQAISKKDCATQTERCCIII